MIPEWMEKWDKGLAEQAKEAAIRHRLDPNWVLAIVAVETAGVCNRTRFEPGWKYFHFTARHAKNLVITEQTERALQAISWGPMQVMGSVAREWGYPDHLQTLSEAIRGLEYGCKHLASMRKRFPTGRDWIAAYNAGHPRKNPDGSYANEEYVKKVVGYWSDLTDT